MGFEGRNGLRAGVGILVAFIVVLTAAPQADAAAPAFLFRVPPDQIAPGPGAGELNHPRGLAVNPTNGHIYISEFNNARISEYTAWGLFVKSWGWGVANGVAEPQTCGPPEPEADPDPSLCRSGIAGSGEGQLNTPVGLSVDPLGNVYVFELGNLRVQKFSPDGKFLLMFGGNVNKTKVEASAPVAQRNVCPVDPADVCQKGSSGEGPSQFSGTFGDFIEYSPAKGGTILVGDKNGIQVFDLDGNYLETIFFSGALAAFAGQSVNGLDVHSDGNIYFTLDSVADVYKIDPGGLPLAPGKPGESKFDVAKPLGVAVDSEGNVYTADIKVLIVAARYVLGYDPSGAPIPGMGPGDEFASAGDDLTSLATNTCADSDGSDLFISHFTSASPPHSYVDAYGSPPIGCELPPKRAPEIFEQFAVLVGREEATVKARINPLFWPDATYFVEYGTGKCSEGGCTSKAPLSPIALTDTSVNKALTTLGVVLEGLTPSTRYHYRFVAQSGGGGPVFGVDPDGKDGPEEATFEEGLEATLRTFRDAPAPQCPNDAVRLRLSAELPDCRAFELVSPLDKGNADVALWRTRNAVRARLLEINQSALSGDGFTFTSANAFGDPESAPFVSQYLSGRDPLHGWSSQPISPSHTESPVSIDGTFANDLRGFTDDLCLGWVRHFSVAPLAEGAVEKYTNLYKRANCVAPPVYVPLTTVEPPQRPANKYRELDIKGFSDDGAHTIFTADDQLHSDAPALDAEELLLYEHTSGGLRFVCYLPDGTPSPQACSAGTLMGTGDSDISSLRNAISDDGSRVFWTAFSGTKQSRPSHPGQIFVRIDGAETRKVSTTKATDPAFFWTASEDGSKAVFSFDSGPHDNELYEVDVDTETPTLIAKEVEGPMGASEDASRIYFASKEDFDGTGPAAAGEHNLYLYEADSGAGGSFTFIMELAAEDIGRDQPSVNDLLLPIAFSPATRAATVSSDGQHAVFTSVASPTPIGYDNLDANSGEPTQEVYLYDAVEDELRCVSCNPMGARPTGEDIGGADPFYVAAQIQGWEALHHAPRVLSDDGTRVFFESLEALVPRDTNATWDVYQWEEAGKGTCTPSSETFSEDSGGCVDLISSGLSSRVSVFFDADPSGDNIFFSTLSSLVGADYGLNDVYVARVGGGFPEPRKSEECEGEACQSPPPPPPEVTPSTETSAGPGNVVRSKPKPRRCPKGKRRVKRAGKVRCVKRKARRQRGARR